MENDCKMCYITKLVAIGRTPFVPISPLEKENRLRKVTSILPKMKIFYKQTLGPSTPWHHGGIPAWAGVLKA